MYKILILLGLLTTFCKVSFSQTSDQDPGTRIAHQMADKMRDSLSLSEKQWNDIFAINKQLQDQKKAAMTSGKDRENIGLAIQQIENTRDSLYTTVLLPAQLQVYKEKKRNLIRKN